MALIKIFTKQENYNELKSHVANSVKLVAAAALNTPEISTTPDSVRTVYVEGINLVDIDFILEVIAVERSDQQRISDDIIIALNQIYPEELFSIYFNNISESSMANTPRVDIESESISMKDAVELAKKGIKNA